MQNLAEKIEQLPIELQQEVEDFVEFVAKKHTKRIPQKPTFNWAGGLKDLKDQYTSVELQHKATDWRIEDALKYKRDKK